MLIEKVGQMLIDLMTVFGQRLLGLHSLQSLPENLLHFYHTFWHLSQIFNLQHIFKYKFWMTF